MVITITNGVKVSIELFYQPDMSSGIESCHIWGYKVIITNNNSYALKIEGRGECLKDTGRKPRYFDRYGIYGRFPTIEPGKSFSYCGGISINSDVATWKAYLLVKNLSNGHYNYVGIPYLELISPDLRN
jgi:ApaG protein